MKNKITIKEFNDPFRKIQSKDKLSPATVVSVRARPVVASKGVSSDEKGEEVKFDPQKKIDDTVPLPSVGKVLDFKAENVDCVEDLISNWELYASCGLLIGATTAPIVRPVLGLAAGAGRRIIAPKTTMKVFGDSVKALQNAEISSLRSAAAPAMAKAGTKLKAFLKGIPGWLVASKEFSAAWQKARTKSFISAGGRTTMGLVKSFKNIFVLALVVGAVWKGSGLKDLAAAGMESEYSAVSMASTVFTVMIEFFVQYDTALEKAMVHVSPTTNKECLMSNVIASSIMVAMMLGSGGGKTAYKSKDLKNMTAAEIKQFIIGEKGLLIDKFNAGLKSELIPMFKKAGIEGAQFEQYYKLLLNGDPEPIARFLTKFSNKKNVDLSTLNSLNDRAQKIFAKQEKEFAAMLIQRAEDNKEAVMGIRKTGEESGVLLNKMLTQARNQAKEIGRDFRAASQAQVNPNQLSLDIPGISTSAKTVGMQLDTARGILKSMDRVDELLETGQLSVRKAAQLYNNHFQRNLTRWSDKFVKTTESLSGVAKNDSERIVKILLSLDELKKSDKYITEALVVLRPNGAAESANWLEKLLLTSKSKRVADAAKLDDLVNNAAIKDTISDIASKLSGRSTITSEDLVKLEKSITEIQEKIAKVSGLGARSGTTKLGARTLVAGATTAIIGSVVRAVSPGLSYEMNDLETYRKQDIAKALAWRGLFPDAITNAVLTSPAAAMNLFVGSDDLDAPSAEQAYQKALISVVRQVFGLADSPGTKGRETSLGLLNNYVFKGNGQFFRNNILTIKSPEELKSELNSILDQFAQEKSNFSTIKSSLQNRFYMALDGIGEFSFSTDKRRVKFTKVWWPIIINILIANVGLAERLNTLATDGDKFDEFWDLKTDDEKINYLNNNVFITINPDDISSNLNDWLRNFYKKELKKVSKTQKNKENTVKEQKQNQEKMILEAVKEMLAESTPRGYNPYPYHSHIGQENEPTEDFQQDWKDFELSVVRDETRDTAIRVAKILVKDLELFGDVIDLIGKNQSVATEILKKLRTTEKTS